MAGWRRKVTTAVLFLGLAAAFSLLALEAGLRLAGGQSELFYQPDPEVGAIHIPRKRGWFVFADGRQYVEINRHGYHDRELAWPKPADVLRIAVLGDSFVEGFQVPRASNFTSVSESRLDGSCGKRLEVLNFGVAGFGTGQELETLRHRALAFAPDLVLLFFYPSNDLFDNSRELDVEEFRLYFELAPGGKLVRLPFVVHDTLLKSWLRHHSRAYLFLRHRIKSLGAARTALIRLRLVEPQIDVKQAQIRTDALQRLQEARYVVPLPAPLERAWQLSEALIVETRRLAEANGARFGVVVVPNREEIADGAAPAERKEGWDPQQSMRRSEEICARRELECLSLLPAFVAAGLEETYFPRDGHWTAAGHALVAAELEGWLSRWMCGSRRQQEPADLH
jgi:hypothetical protein